MYCKSFFKTAAMSNAKITILSQIRKAARERTLKGVGEQLGCVIMTSGRAYVPQVTIGTASTKSAKFRGIRPWVYIEDLF